MDRGSVRLAGDGLAGLARAGLRWRRQAGPGPLWPAFFRTGQVWPAFSGSARPSLARGGRARLGRRLPRPPRGRPWLVRPAALAAGLTWLTLGVALFTVYLHMS